MDEAGAAAAATEQLLTLGHQRIGFITGSDQYALSHVRAQAYRDAMQAGGQAVDPELIARGDFTFASGVAATKRLLALPDPPTAIVASSDQMSLAALQVARQAGLDVPRDLSLVSFDDTPIVKFSVPPLTAIRQPIAEMTACAAVQLIRAANGEPVDDKPSLLPFQLIVRGSTAPPGR
jgi:LacI family transcriptional regulator